MLSIHIKLETAIVEGFCRRFAPNAKSIFLRGDTTRLSLFDEVAFCKLDVSLSSHANFPDVLLYDRKRDWLFLIEAAGGKDYISQNRYIELSTTFKKCGAGKIYVTAFWKLDTYIKYSEDIAWETEVWIAEMPSHMIHFNGDKFLGPR